MDRLDVLKYIDPKTDAILDFFCVKRGGIPPYPLCFVFLGKEGMMGLMGVTKVRALG